MRWGLFQTAEYINLITLSGARRDALLRRLARPVLDATARARSGSCSRSSSSSRVFIWIRASLPRLRYDQLMRFGWKVLLPVATINAVITAFLRGAAIS